MEQEPRHTSSCTLSYENSSDYSSVNKQGLYFIFPPFLLPWPTSSPRVESSSASKLLRGPRERDNLLRERHGSKGARGCWSKVNYLAHSRSWLFHFAKVSACLFRLHVVLSPLSGSMRQGHAGEARAAHMLVSLLLPYKRRFPAGTVPGQRAQLLQLSLPAAVLLCRTWHRQSSSSSQSSPTAVKLTKSSPFVPTLRFLIA